MMLSERANILTLREIGGGVQFSWVPQACIWCKSELKTQGNIFRKSGSVREQLCLLCTDAILHRKMRYVGRANFALLPTLSRTESI